MECKSVMQATKCSTKPKPGGVDPKETLVEVCKGVPNQGKNLPKTLALAEEDKFALCRRVGIVPIIDW